MVKMWRGQGCLRVIRFGFVLIAEKYWKNGRDRYKMDDKVDAQYTNRKRLFWRFE